MKLESNWNAIGMQLERNWKRWEWNWHVIGKLIVMQLEAIGKYWECNWKEIGMQLESSLKAI